MQEIECGKTYRHFKGNFYLLINTAFHSETSEQYVVYQALYGEFKTFIRPQNMFFEEVDVNREDNITKQKYRFERMDIKC